VALAAIVAAGATFLRREPPAEADHRAPMSREEQIRHRLFAELQPVKLANCELERFGEPNDGGYLLCGNLLGAVGAGYSYGISGYDGWGCDISRRLDVTVHQYDCFDARRPACPGGKTVFHDECVAGTRSVDEGRVFDTVQNQLARNGDETRHLVVKMDVERAEWDVFLRMPDAVLNRIDQLAVEFHEFHEERFVAAVQRLKKSFYVAHLHFNNFSCIGGQPPFPAWAYEVLFVSKRLVLAERSLWQASKDWLFGLMPDTLGKAEIPNALDAPNNPRTPDCQAL
jgi:hypothetical protein